MIAITIKIAGMRTQEILLGILDRIARLPRQAVDSSQPVQTKMLYLVGLGLSDETDITVKGLEVVKKASRVYLEAYTSILLVDQAVLVRTKRRSCDTLGGRPLC